MPPITRSSIHGARPREEPDPSAVPEIEDEDMEFEHEMASSELEDDIAEDDVSSPLQASAQELLRPLQETSDRVDRQMEQFAQIYDRFISSKRTTKESPLQKTMVLMEDFGEVALQDARQSHSKSSSKLAQKNRKSLGDSALQKQSILLEARLWQLNSRLLPCRDPELIEQSKFRQNTAVVELHRYTTDAQLWQAFLEVDVIASQCEIILEWLQEWKSETSSDLKESELDSYSVAQRGQGLWAGGNIFTQGPIKSQKLRRAQHGPLSPSPEVRNSHRRNPDQAILVTQMDPDARTRQDAFLEPEDEAFESAAWHASWEMLRRGMPVKDIRQWWRDRNEDWRLLLLRNSALQQDLDITDSWRRIVNLASGREYLNACNDLSELDFAMNKFERAVYGIMCGNYAATIPVCTSLDDHFFALFNEILIERYNQFLDRYRERLQDVSIQSYIPPPTNIKAVSQYFIAAQSDKSTRAECHQPHKYFQGMLLSDDHESFLTQMGYAAARMAHLTGQSRHLFDKVDEHVNECAQVAAQDEDVVRITAHLQLALQEAGLLDKAIAENQVILENNILNYIGLLERHGKYALIPLYASRLATDRQPRALGRILSKVTEPRERDLQMKLMKQYKIPTYRVIYTICEYTRKMWGMDVEDSDEIAEPTKIIEYENKIAHIRHGFIGKLDESNFIARVVDAYEWISHIDAKNWGMAVWLMTTLYKDLLISGNIAAAKELATRVEFSETSRKVTGMNLSIGALPLDETVEENGRVDADRDGSEEELLPLASPTKRRKESRTVHPLTEETTDRSKLSERSILWEQLQHLVLALQILEEWQDMADYVETLPRDDLSTMKRSKKGLSEMLAALNSAMQPLLEEDFLDHPFDEREDADLTAIRNHYLPECILAFNSALYFAGHSITRQHLTQCMELAQKVATTESLTQAFVVSKRMSELVAAFASDSRALLKANEALGGKPLKGNKRPTTGLRPKPDIWQVKLK